MWLQTFPYLQVVKVTVFMVFQAKCPKSKCYEETRVHIECPIAVTIRWVVTRVTRWFDVTVCIGQLPTTDWEKKCINIRISSITIQWKETVIYYLSWSLVRCQSFELVLGLPGACDVQATVKPRRLTEWSERNQKYRELWELKSSAGAAVPQYFPIM